MSAVPCSQCGEPVDFEAVEFCAKCRTPAREPQDLPLQSRWIIGLNAFLNSLIALFFSWILAFIVFALVHEADFDVTALTILVITLSGFVYFWRTVYLVLSGKARARATASLAIGILLLALISVSSISNFAYMMRRSVESATKGNLGAIRSAISAYSEEAKGKHPNDLAALTAEEKYLKTIFVARLPASFSSYHPDSARILHGASADDAGGWLHDKTRGKIWVNCTHTDSKGSVWSSY